MAQVRLALPKTTNATQGTQLSLNQPATSLNPVTLTALGTGDTTTATSASRNPYVGAQAGYVFGGGDFASNLVANGSVVYQVLQATIGKAKLPFFLPVRGNVASLVAAKSDTDRTKQVQKLVNAAEGMHVSIEPSLQLWSNDYAGLTWVSSAGWKLNAVKDKLDSTHYLALGRFSTGAEFVVGPRDGSKNPIVLDVSPVYSTFAGREYRKVLDTDKSIWSGEFTLVVPLATSTGLLTEAIMSQHAFPVWRTGLILTASSK